MYNIQGTTIGVINMRVDISHILSKKGAAIPFELLVMIENVEGYPDVVDFLEPVTIKGTVTNAEGLYSVNADVSTKVSMECGQCLAPVEVEVYFILNEDFSNSGSTNGEIETFSGEIIDLTAVISKNILFSLPMKVSCKEDCKGLCPKCGKDLNKGDCGCDTTYVDPRFESLRSLFKVDEEV